MTTTEEYIELTSDSGMPVIKNEVGMEFIYIPAGEFMMGASPGDEDASDDEKPAHKVRITNGFYMGKYPVTQKQWNDVMVNNPRRFHDDCPVGNVSWNDVQEFIEKLNGLGVRNQGTGVREFDSESENPKFIYRLPTEAEWEYAARAESTTKYYFGDDESKLGDYAWYNGNSYSNTHLVGQKKSNQFGLYDMLGNVWEWCEDWYDENYYKQFENKIAVYPKGAELGSYRVYRGGSWNAEPLYVRSSARNRWLPGFRYGNLGFRLVLVSL